MKNLRTPLFISILLFSGYLVQAQDSRTDNINPYQFSAIIDLEATPVKDQAKSGTCWSYAGSSFVESELLRQGKEHIDLSEMFAVRMAYVEKAKKYVRLHGKINFAQGGEPADVLHCIKKHGAMPQNAYTGLTGGAISNNHDELVRRLKEFLDELINSEELRPTWLMEYNNILDEHLGVLPAEFEYNGTMYNPRTFADEHLSINIDDYIYLTSFTHQPFFTPFILEIPDNWRWEQFYNLPLGAFMNSLNSALNKGFTVSWAMDNSEIGFSREYGIAVTSLNSWNNMGDEERVHTLEFPHDELTVNQVLRQEEFDLYSTQDDHSMHITGTATDQTGAKFYIVKNSWGERPYPHRNGYFFVSESYMQLKSIGFLMHKDALPKGVRQNLGL